MNTNFQPYQEHTNPSKCFCTSCVCMSSSKTFQFSMSHRRFVVLSSPCLRGCLQTWSGQRVILATSAKRSGLDLQWFCVQQEMIQEGRKWPLHLCRFWCSGSLRGSVLPSFTEHFPFQNWLDMLGCALKKRVSTTVSSEQGGEPHARHSRGRPTVSSLDLKSVSSYYSMLDLLSWCVIYLLHLLPVKALLQIRRFSSQPSQIYAWCLDMLR